MQRTVIDPARVNGWGVDADPENDPTYPMRDVSQDKKEGMNWQRPALQPNSVEILQSTEHKRRTAVFGTSSPPSGLSGVIRRGAFKRSEGKWDHWLMLLLADRINVVEGILQDLGRGRIPNIPAEMGIRSEVRHNLPGLIQKMAIAGGILMLSAVAVRAMRSSEEDRRPRRRRAVSERSARRRADR